MENNQLRQTMEYCQKNHLIVKIYDDEYELVDDGEWVGYIEHMNEDEILFHHISEAGEDDGFVWKTLDSVYRADCGGKYERKIEMLSERRKSNLKVSLYNKDSILTSLFEESIRNDMVITVVTDDDDFYGIVKKYDDETVVLQEIDEYGDEESVVVMESERISTARYAGIEEQNRKYLWERKK